MSTRAHSLPVVFPPQSLGLRGEHQAENARTAWGVVRRLRKWFRVSDDSIRIGLEAARHPGRLEVFDKVMLDGAHNANGARALRRYIESCIDKPIILIFGAVNGKDVAAMAAELFPLAHHIIFAHSFNSRALDPVSLLKTCPRSLWGKKPTSFLDLTHPDAVEGLVSTLEGTILVTGSLYLVGKVRQILLNQI